MTAFPHIQTVRHAFGQTLIVCHYIFQSQRSLFVWVGFDNEPASLSALAMAVAGRNASADVHGSALIGETKTCSRDLAMRLGKSIRNLSLLTSIRTQSETSKIISTYQHCFVSLAKRHQIQCLVSCTIDDENADLLFFVERKLNKDITDLLAVSGKQNADGNFDSNSVRDSVRSETTSPSVMLDR